MNDTERESWLAEERTHLDALREARSTLDDRLRLYRCWLQAGRAARVATVEHRETFLRATGLRQ